ncbi:ead/Ea22-like family protein [Escherichia coli]|uniref:ead/Ea22-like family protein n=1 Tax=Escherichia coli TaxID=562 RepID=UPI0038969BB0
MKLFEMEGFLRGKCIPRDLKVNETNAEYLVRKFGELESKLETALRECRSAGITIDNLEAKCAALAVENAGIKSAIPQLRDIDADNDNMDDVSLAEDFGFNHAIERMRRQIPETPATDAFLAEVRASAIPDEATERDLFEEWVMEKIFISKTTLEGLRTDDGYRNSTLSGTDYNGMWSQWKAIRAAQLRQEAAQ